MRHFYFRRDPDANRFLILMAFVALGINAVMAPCISYMRRVRYEQDSQLAMPFKEIVASKTSDDGDF
jgi:hypothetical protein